MPSTIRFAAFSGLSPDIWERLYQGALHARLRAHAPYSNFLVGAALLTTDGQIIEGCNVENATFGATVCAERTAFVSAVALGQRSFQALCVVTQASPPSAPCGICRQIIAEFCTELPILVANLQGESFFTTLSQLLPFRFAGKDFLPASSDET